MDDTLGIDCPKSYNFDNSLAQGTPQRLSLDFIRGTFLSLLVYIGI